MLNIGRLNTRITIQRKSETVTATGGIIPAWTDIATVWAEIVTASASEFLTGFGEAQSNTTVFRIHWRDDLTIADRVMLDGRHCEIKEIAKLGHRDGLELRAVALS
jgi:SPP1 family predicted phage head-tail adaptor